MRKKLKIGITYDVKEDYGFYSNDWKHSDFCTLAEIDYIKNLFEARGHSVSLIGNYEKLYSSLKNSSLPSLDIVFNTAEGINSRNREGWVPSLLEINGIAYTGSDAYGLSLSLNKAHTKIIAKHLGINTPDFYLINNEGDAIYASEKIQGPWILKPNYEGSSSGVAYADSSSELIKRATELIIQYRQPLLCETFIDGTEANVSVLYDGGNTEVIGIVEVVRKNDMPIKVFNVVDKYTGTCTKVPSSYSDKINQQLADSTVSLHKYMGCLDFNRGDYRIDKSGRVYF